MDQVKSKYTLLANNFLEYFRMREKFIEEYGFAIPNPEVIKYLANNGPWIEIGCGKAYWASLIQKESSVDYIIPVDDFSWSGVIKINYEQPYTSIIMGDENVVYSYSDRNLLLIWPPYQEPMAFNAAKLLSVGKILCYVGEGYGGCTADDAFHEYLESNFEEIDHNLKIDQFYGIHDRIFLYKKVKE